MEDVLHGSVWSTVSTMLDTDDVVRLRVAAICWNEGRRYGKMGGIFFQLLHSEPFVKHWYYDDMGYKLCTLKYLIMESFPKWELQESQMFIPPLDLCSYDCEDMSLKVEGRMYDLFINQRCAECHSIGTMSNGSMSPDLGEMCRHGYPASPQWEGELELDSASDCDNEHEEGDRLVARNRAAENGPKDNISVLRGSSLWILIRDSLGPPDVLVLRTAGSKWNNAKLYGEFAALRFFLLTKDGSEERDPVTLPEWHSLCFDYRQNFGLTPSMIRSGGLPNMTAFNCLGAWT